MSWQSVRRIAKENCKENRRNGRYLIELRAVRSLEKNCEVFRLELRVVRRMLGEMQRYLIELRAVKELRTVSRMARYLYRVGSCKENVRRNDRYLIELRAVRSLLEELRGI